MSGLFESRFVESEMFEHFFHLRRTLVMYLSPTQVNQLCIQSAQNAANRFLTRSNISPNLNPLHWLQIIYKVQFEILVCIYKALHSQASDYIVGFFSIM